MRFLSVALPLVLAAGCSLIDAAGDSVPSVGGGGYRRSNISNTGGSPLGAVITDLNGTPGLDVVVVGGGQLFTCINMGDTATFTVMAQPGTTDYRTITAAKLDASAAELIATTATTAVVIPTNATGGFGTPIALTSLPGKEPKVIVGGRLFAANPAVAVAYVESPIVRVFTDPLVNGATFTDITLEGSVLDLAIGNVSGSAVGDELVVSYASKISVFTSPTTKVDLALPASTSAPHIAVANFERQSPEDDIAWVNLSPGPGSISIAAGAAAGPIAQTALFADGVGGDDLQAVFANDDAFAELALLSTDNEGRRQLQLFTSTNNPASWTQATLEIDGLARTLVVGDIDSDGRSDFLLLPGKQGGVDMLISD